MFKKCLLLLICTCFVDAQFEFASCPYPRLIHGRTRLRQRWRLVRFSCLTGYELVGNRYATCRNGQWDEPIPVCVRPGCDVPKLDNGIRSLSHNDAWMRVFCLPGYTLMGSGVIYCDGYNWNATAPKCVDSQSEVKLSCDFEDTYLCGWTQDELHDFDWKRLNIKTPSSYHFTGPSYDHTYGPGGNGYYMYIESTSKRLNQTARLLSPIYDAVLTKDGCFSFYYHMYGGTIGGLRVYQKPDNITLPSLLAMSQSERMEYQLFEKWGPQGDVWYDSVTPLKPISIDFQIVIEGIRGTSFTSDIAIDDVAILRGENCTLAAKYATTPSSVFMESCSDRCDVVGRISMKLLNACGCTLQCVLEDNCCPDFVELCIYNNSSKQDDDTVSTETTSATEYLQTEKLIASDKTTSAPKNLTTSTSTSTTTTLSPITATSTTTTTTTTSTTAAPTTTKATTTRATTTMKIHATSLNETTSTTKVTPKTVTTPKMTTTKVLVAKGNVTRKTYYNKDEIRDNNQHGEDKSITENTSDGGGIIKGLIVTVATIGCCFLLVYIIFAMRSSRGRLAIARLRGRSTHNSEVRYLNSAVDEE